MSNLKHDNVIRIFSLCFAVLVLLGCTERQTTFAGGRATRGDWLLELWSSNICPKLGETVVVRATITNKAPQHQIVQLETGPVLDLVINDGTRTIRWSELDKSRPATTRLELGPGESKTIEMTWLVESVTNVLKMQGDFIDNPTDPRGPMRAIGQMYVGICPGGH